MRISAYVDALNLYYGALKNTSYKWLNLVQFVNLTIADIGSEIENLKYFTASVSGKGNPQAPRRQKIYLNALETLPEVSVVYGNFKTNGLWRPLLNLPIADCEVDLHTESLKIPVGDFPVHVSSLHSRIVPVRPWHPHASRVSARKKEMLLNDAIHVKVHSMEEKGSDVNLAVHLLHDAWRDVYDEAVVISNDRDLTESIRLVVDEVGKKVTVVCPSRNSRVAKRLEEVASGVKYVRSAQLRKAQFPISISGTSIRKPEGW